MFSAPLPYFNTSLVTIPRFLRSHRTVLALRMDSTASQLKTGSPFVADADTEAFGMELRHAGKLDEAGQTFTRSQEQAGADAESGSVAAQADGMPETAHGPEGIRFSLLFTCILLGSFFIGYVRAADPSQERCPS